MLMDGLQWVRISVGHVPTNPKNVVRNISVNNIDCSGKIQKCTNIFLVRKKKNTDDIITGVNCQQIYSVGGIKKIT